MKPNILLTIKNRRLLFFIIHSVVLPTEKFVIWQILIWVSSKIWSKVSLYTRTILNTNYYRYVNKEFNNFIITITIKLGSL